MKHLVTHIKPHLDDIAGIWLFARFHPDYTKAEVNFTEVTIDGGKPFGGKPVDSDSDVIHIGVCRGKFDEHGPAHADEIASAATIVLDHLKEEGYVKEGSLEDQALSRLAGFVLMLDTGEIKGKELSDFTVGSVIQGMSNRTDKNAEDLSQEMYGVGVQMLDALYAGMQDSAVLTKDWKNHIDLETSFGKIAALETTSMKADDYAYSQKYSMVILVQPEKGYRQFRANRDSNIDLTSVYEKLQAADPKAEWYLHQSKKLLICGHDIAPETKLSKLSLSELIDIVKSVS